MAYLKWLRDVARPRVMISENVTTGNIGEKITELLSSAYDCKDACLVWPELHLCFLQLFTIYTFQVACCPLQT